MKYNFAYLFTALIFLLVLGVHYSQNKQIRTNNNLLFRIIYSLGLLDIILDIFVSFMIENPSPTTTGILNISLVFFYVLQILFPYFFLVYTYSLQENSDKQIKKMVICISTVTFIGVLFMVVNPFFGYIYSVDAFGNYIIGPYYHLVYIYCFVYLLMAGFGSILFFKQIGKKNFITIWEFVFIILFFVFVQFKRPDLLTTGLGLSLGIFLFYLNTNNPEYSIDQLTNMLDNSQFPALYYLIEKEKKRMYLLVIDLYNLKDFNKIYGIYYGDVLLKKVAKHIDYKKRSASYSFRIKGNRFLVCCTDRNTYKLRKEEITQFLKKESEGDIPLDSLLIQMEDLSSFTNPDALIDYIEYLSQSIHKEKGFYYLEDTIKTRKGYEWYLSIESYITEAVDKNLFSIYYQPIYSLNTGKYDSAEALTRLFHPKLGQLNTELVFKIANEKGLQKKISKMQFENLIEFLQENPDIYLYLDHIKYNVSPVELMDEEHINFLIQCIEKSKLDFSKFKFEITEQISLKYSKEVDRVVDKLKNYGIRLILDDFGTGYSSMYSVLSLPFETIKIGRSLLKDIESEEKIYIFYKRLVDTFHRLGYTIVSEGIETENEWELLRSFHVDYLQGYYCSRPLDDKAFLAFCRKENS
ncbi:MAG: EAL domain-containing protein [Bacillota bacterium]|nr:EAL domain-containing protein [Bacillota bacterium]